MQLAFTMDALDAAGRHAWRLQKDMRRWRACTFAEPARADDALLAGPAEAEKLHGRRLRRDRESGLIFRDKPGRFDFLMRGIFSHAVLHRFSAAPVPDKHQMLETIAALRPGTPWLVHLDVAGHFRALDTTSEGILGNLRIAVRGEIASAEGYVGKAAAADDTLMDLTYRQFLGGWLEHLQTGRMGVFVPDIEKLKEQADCLAAIHAWRPEPEPV